MKKIFKLKIIIVIMLLLIPISSFAEKISDREVELHVGASVIFGGISETYLHHKTDLTTSDRILIGTIMGSVPGLAKEIFDGTEKENHFNGIDMAANGIGAFLGSVIANHINNKIQISFDKQREKTKVFLSYRF